MREKSDTTNDCNVMGMQVQDVSVSGSRYWPQHVSNVGHESTLDALYRTHTLYVQRKSGALSYMDDPSGVRSLLSTAFHKVDAIVDLCRLALPLHCCGKLLCVPFSMWYCR